MLTETVCTVPKKSLNKLHFSYHKCTIKSFHLITRRMQGIVGLAL